MKQILQFSMLLLTCFLIENQDIFAQEKLTNYELKPDQVVSFDDRHMNLKEHKDNGTKVSKHELVGDFKRGAYDGVKFHLELFMDGEVIVSDVRGTKGIHQNEFLFYNCNGNMSRQNDTIKIKTNSNASELYLVSINGTKLASTLSGEVEIQLVCTTLDNTYCPALVRTDNFVTIVALPEGIDQNEIYKPSHKENTVGIFSYFSITDKNNITTEYPAGDYILIGGDKIKYKN